MKQLNRQDVNALMAFLEDGGQVTSLERFRRYVVDGLARLIEHNAVGYNEVNLEQQSVVLLFEPEEKMFPERQALFSALMHEHPLINYYAQTSDGRAFKISDFLSAAQFHRLALYQDFFRPIEAEDQIAITLPSASPILIGVAFNRPRRSFRQRDRLLLNLARPYLANFYSALQREDALARSLDALYRASEATDQAVILIDTTGKPRMVTAAAGALLREFGLDFSPGSRSDQLSAWLEAQRTGLDGGFAQRAPAESLIVTRPAGQLALRYLPPLQPADPAVVILEPPTRPLEPERLRSLGLTIREADVLANLAHGRTNKQIAAALSMSVGTVRTHLMRIYEALGVNNRVAAVLRAQEVMRGNQPLPRNTPSA